VFRALLLLSLIATTSLQAADAPDLSFAGLVVGFQSEFINGEHPLFNASFPNTKSIIIKPLHEKDEAAEYSPGLTKKFQLHLLLNICKKNQPCEEQLYAFPIKAELKVTNDNVLGIHYDLSRMVFEFEKFSWTTPEGKPITLYITMVPVTEGPLKNDPQSQIRLEEPMLVITDGNKTEMLRLIPRLIFG
jgi:hypothetical protein